MKHSNVQDILFYKLGRFDILFTLHTFYLEGLREIINFENRLFQVSIFKL